MHTPDARTDRMPALRFQVTDQGVGRRESAESDRPAGIGPTGIGRMSNLPSTRLDCRERFLKSSLWTDADEAFADFTVLK